MNTARKKWFLCRDVPEPANIRRMRMRICRAIKITSYYGYCNSIYLLKIKQLQTYKQWTIEMIKKTQQTSINQCTVTQLYFCCNIHNDRDALNYFGSQQVTEFSQQLAFWIRRDRNLSIRRISDLRKSAGFRRIRNPSHPYFYEL